MGTGCSKCAALEPIDSQLPSSRQDSPDPAMYDLMRRSVEITGQQYNHKSETHSELGQYHLLYKQQRAMKLPDCTTANVEAAAAAADADLDRGRTTTYT